MNLMFLFEAYTKQEYTSANDLTSVFLEIVHIELQRSLAADIYGILYRTA